MLLRDERQMAVNAVEKLCFETANRYEMAASDVGDPGLEQMFRALSGQRRQLTAELATQIRLLDDLPQQPDPDRETVTHMLTGIKSFLSGDARATLIADCAHGEEALANAVQAALRQDLPGEALDVLRRILAHSEAAQRELAGAHS